MPTSLTQEVVRLLRAVALLEATAKGGWVPWPRVARKLEGTEQFTDLVKALTDLPEAKPLFSKNEKVIKLSSYVWAVYNKLPPDRPEQEPVTIQIANAVKEYASTLQPLRFRVDSVSPGARVGSRVVQAVFMDSEETFAADTPVTFRSITRWRTTGKVVGQEPDGTAVYAAFHISD